MKSTLFLCGFICMSALSINSQSITRKKSGKDTIEGKLTSSPSKTPSEYAYVYAKENCKLCTETWKVPYPSLSLLGQKCSYWNQQEMKIKNCQNIQATYGSACGCVNPPPPKCQVCGNGDYSWFENFYHNSFIDDLCVRVIYRLSNDKDLCVEAKDRVAKMCCISNASKIAEKTSNTWTETKKLKKSSTYN